MYFYKTTKMASIKIVSSIQNMYKLPDDVASIIKGNLALSIIQTRFLERRRNKYKPIVDFLFDHLTHEGYCRLLRTNPSLDLQFNGFRGFSRLTDSIINDISALEPFVSIQVNTNQCFQHNEYAFFSGYFGNFDWDNPHRNNIWYAGTPCPTYFPNIPILLFFNNKRILKVEHLSDSSELLSIPMKEGGKKSNLLFVKHPLSFSIYTFEGKKVAESRFEDDEIYWLDYKIFQIDEEGERPRFHLRLDSLSFPLKIRWLE